VKCRICSGETREQFSLVILNKYTIRYFLCGTCSFLHTEEPYWLKEAYADSASTNDTGIVARSIYLSKLVTVLISLELNKKASFLDFGGGCGLFTRLMRDVGFDYYWSDPYADNLLAKGFEYDPENGSVELVTSFESFEHFADPMKELTQMFSYSPSIFFSTETLPLPPPPPGQWYYYAPHHGQHVSLYSLKTFKYIAGRFNVNYYTNGNDLHLLTRKKIPSARLQLTLRYGKFLYPLLKRRMRSRTTEDASRGLINPNAERLS
jgi:hypothetical protein